MTNRLIDDMVAFIRDNAEMLAAISTSRGHATITLEVRDGAVSDGAVALKFKRGKTTGMGVIAASIHNSQIPDCNIKEAAGA
jgi:hypothetical protein